MNNLPIFLQIIFKTHPYLRSSVRFTQSVGYSYVCGYNHSVNISNRIECEISFPQEYRNEILMILKFCGLRPNKEEYDSSGVGYLYFDKSYNLR